MTREWQVTLPKGSANGNGNGSVSPDRRRNDRDRRNRVSPRRAASRLPTVSVIIPTLNEERNLRFVLPHIPKWVDEVVVVDGRSTDDTIGEARRLRPDVVIALDPEPGKGRALMTGMHASTGDILVTLDADGSMDPKEIPRYVYGLLSGADFVKGSRFMHGGATEDMGVIRRVGNRGLTASVRKLYGGRFSDLCYGYNAFWRDVLPYLEGRAHGFEIETHMTVRALSAGLQILEVPSFEAKRVHGASNLRVVNDGFRVLRTVIAERKRLAGAPFPPRAPRSAVIDLTDSGPTATGADLGSPGRGLSLSATVCTHDIARWADLVRAVDSLRSQTVLPLEIIVVVDHNPALLAKAQAELHNVRVVASTGDRGLSGARNTAVGVAKGDVTAFLDDDAHADVDWIERLLDAYSCPEVLAVGGAVLPSWDTERPNWMPEEFDWVVGCTYRGLPELRSPVRNLVGANMSFRSDVLRQIGGFDAGLGRRGHDAAGCEETELCIRAQVHFPGSTVIFEPSARVWHRVPAERSTWEYFVKRCRAEGRSKAVVSALAGRSSALASERTYLTRTLPAGIVRNVARAARFDAGGLVNAGSMVAGSALAGSHFAHATWRRRRIGETEAVPPTDHVLP